MKPSRIRLDYGSLGSARTDPKQHLLNNISAVVQAGEHLWLASDEGCTVERLSWGGRGYAKPVSYHLSAYFALPKGGVEIDVEALSIAIASGSRALTVWFNKRRPAPATANVTHENS